MNISIIGFGKLGLCFGLALERAGQNVLGVDVSSKYINEINDKTFNSLESEVNEYLMNSSNLKATDDIKVAIDYSDYIFCFVTTPSLPDGRYDHLQIDNIVSQLIYLGHQKIKKHFIIGCTTMPGYCNSIKDKLEKYNYTVSYNPEFISQGSILKDLRLADMVLIGASDLDVISFLKNIYLEMCDNSPSVHIMSQLESEITKLALNCYITTKISYANMIGDIISSVGGDPAIVLSAIGSDSRVGHKALKYGFGYGGPCFPRDNRALSIFASDNKLPSDISIATDQINKKHLDFLVDNYSGKDSVTFTSVTYKPETTIIEESQQLEYAIRLANRGIAITIKERPEVVDQIKLKYGDLFTYEVR